MRNFLFFFFFFLPFLYNFLTIPEKDFLVGQSVLVYMKQKISTKKEGTEIVRGTDA